MHEGDQSPVEADERPLDETVWATLVDSVTADECTPFNYQILAGLNLPIYLTTDYDDFLTTTRRTSRRHSSRSSSTCTAISTCCGGAAAALTTAGPSA